MAMVPGTRLGPYEVVAPLGSGGMGEVYRARDTKLGRDVALKVLPPEVAGDAERLARFRREAQVLASLNHPHIAAIHGLEEADGKPFLVLELVEGETLQERLARGRMPLDDALPIARQIAETLEEAHEHGIVHRDLKPANVKLTPEGKVKVLDFGLAKAFGGDAEASPSDVSHSPTLTREGTEAGVILGSAAYMSPEQVLGKPLDGRSDLFSLGAVLYEMATGKVAFPGETSGAIFDAFLHKTPTSALRLNPEPPVELERVVAKCLEKERDLRYQSAADLRADLKRFKRDSSSGESATVAAAAGSTSFLRFRRRGIGRALALVLLSGSSSASAQSGPPATPYEEALRRYRSGDREGATAEVCTWPEGRLRDQVSALSAITRAAGSCPDCAAALMLHTDCAREARRGGGAAGPHESLAIEIAGLMKDDLVRRSFVVRWHGAMTGLAVGENRWDDAVTWAERGLRDFPDSGEMLLVLGSIEETLGTLGVAPAVSGTPTDLGRGFPNVVPRTDPRDRLVKARRLLRAALDAAPGLQEARLRLGRVAWRLGEAAEARSALEQLLAARPEPSTVFLARLFLGRLQEDEGRLDEAARSYAAALALDPRCQSAHLALSHVRLRQGDSTAARREAEEAVKPAGYRQRSDPLWLYPWGAAVDAEERLAALRREASS